MTLFEYDDRLDPIRTGRFAEATAVLVWLVAIGVTLLTPAGLLLAGVLFGLSANSVSRAFAAAGSFAIVVVGACALSLLVVGSLPVVLPTVVEDSLLAVAVFTLVLPPLVAALMRAVG